MGDEQEQQQRYSQDANYNFVWCVRPRLCSSLSVANSNAASRACNSHRRHDSELQTLEADPFVFGLGEGVQAVAQRPNAAARKNAGLHKSCLLPAHSIPPV